MAGDGDGMLLAEARLHGLGRLSLCVVDSIVNVTNQNLLVDDGFSQFGTIPFYLRLYGDVTLDFCARAGANQSLSGEADFYPRTRED
ncbi:hypothetical protein SUGI_1134820 [Cryptomeria japonica]|nr:hypothetical protein SUGI_1134820 [Cryptomeria japonica]